MKNRSVRGLAVMRVLLIVASSVLAMAWLVGSTHAQSTSSSDCPPQYLESLFKVDEIVPCIRSINRGSGGRIELFTPKTATELQGLRSGAATEFTNWNAQFGLVVEALRPTLYQTKKSGALPTNYNRYKDALVAKLALYRKYNLMGSVQVFGAPPQEFTDSHLKTLFSVYEMKAPSCQDQTPVGICLCNLTKSPVSGEQFGPAFTKCARLLAMRDITSPVGNPNCSFKGTSMRDLAPSSKCGCQDVSNVFFNATLPGSNRQTCALTLAARSALDGNYTISCPYTRVPANNPNLLDESICLPLKNGKDHCVSRTHLSKTYQSRDPSQSKTVRYMNLSFDDIDASLGSDEFGCPSSPYSSSLPSWWTSWWQKYSSEVASKSPDSPVQAPAPPIPPVQPKDPPAGPSGPVGGVGGGSGAAPGNYSDNSDIDEFESYRLRGRDYDLYRNASDSTVWPPVLDPATQSVLPPSSKDPYWPQRKKSLEYLKGIQDARQRAFEADVQATSLMADLRTFNRLKKEELWAIKRLALKSAAYETAIYNGLKQQLYTDAAFLGISLVLKLNPVSGTIMSIVTGKLARKVSEKIVHDSNEAGLEEINGPGQFVENIAVGTGVGVGTNYAVEWGIKKASLAEVERTFAVIDTPSFKNPATNTLVADIRKSITTNAAKLTVNRVMLASGAFTVTKAFVDVNNYLSRDVGDSNPFEVAMAQQELGIKNLNKIISQRNSELGAAISIRDGAIKELRERFCKDADGNPKDEVGCT